MPTIRVDLFAGRTPEQKQKFAQAVTQAVVEHLGSSPDSVDIIYYDIQRHDWATGGKLWSLPKDKPSP